jgi:hypothetical protein
MAKQTTQGYLHEAGTDFKYSVTDANNCNAANGTFTVVEPEAIIATAITVDNSNCTVCSDGSINLTVTGGSLPYTFVWSNRLQLKIFQT